MAKSYPIRASSLPTSARVISAKARKLAMSPSLVVVRVVVTSEWIAIGAPLFRAPGAMRRGAPPIPYPGSPSRCAEERSFGRIRAGVCLSAASLARPRPKRAPQVPVAPAEGADSWGAFLWVTFGVHVTLLRKVSEPRVQSTPFAQKKTRVAGFCKSYCAVGRTTQPGMLADPQKTSTRQ